MCFETISLYPLFLEGGYMRNGLKRYLSGEYGEYFRSGMLSARADSGDSEGIMEISNCEIIPPELPFWGDPDFVRIGKKLKRCHK